jgi:ketosteroid isomerase-like protein
MDVADPLEKNAGWLGGGTSMSAEQNKALVRRFFDAQTKGDLAAVEEMMTLDFVNHHRGSMAKNAAARAT